jgi:PAS domain S-box-containing protein
LLGLEEKSETPAGTKWVSSTKVAIRGEKGEITGLVGISRDITARKLAEEELQRKTAFLEAQMNSSIDGILVVDEEGRKTLQNQQMIDMFKIPQSIADDKDDARLLQWFKQVTKNPEQFFAKVHHLYTHPDEIIRDEIELLDGTILDRYSAPMRGQSGKSFGRMWTFRDVTERKQAEEELRWKNAFWEAQVNSSSDGIIVVDQQGKKILQNQRMIDMFKVPAHLAADRTAWGQRQWVADLTTNPGLFLDKIEYFYSQPNEISCSEVKLKDGTILDLLSSPVISRSGKYYGRIWAFRDITERKHAEAALRDSEEKYRGLFEHSLDAILTIDPVSGKFISGNPAALKIFRAKSEAELVSYCPADLSPERQPDGSTSVESAAKIYEIVRRERSHCFEWSHRRINGEEFFASVMLASMERGGKPTILATVRDITERKLLEAQLFQAQKLESIGQLAAGIAHEINTPTQYVGDNTRFVKDSFDAISKVLQCHEELLAAAKQNAIAPELLARNEEILAASDLDYLRDQIPSALKETLEGVERVSKIVRAMKEFSHPGGNDKTPADLNKAIESTATVARNEWKYVAELKLELEPDLPFIPCFIGEFNQAILNLIVNAAHAIGDVVKTTPGAKGLITVKTRREGDWVEIRVTDTGTGIPEFARPKIFAQFFTTKEVGKGTGQGLAMIYGSIVKRHSGTVTFETVMGKGTSFVIRLPLKPKLAPETTSARSPETLTP